MFTGIISAQTDVRTSTKHGVNTDVSFALPKRWKLQKGESVAVDGICGTVIAVSKRAFTIAYMPETLKKTTAASFVPGCKVNLERSLIYGERIDGHFVQGHVDAVGKVTRVENGKGGVLLSVAIPKAFQNLVTTHGSIAFNGVSLTVARYSRGSATVAVIPYTQQHTNLGALTPGASVNIEVDLLARYRQQKKNHGTVATNAKKELHKRSARA